MNMLHRPTALDELNRQPVEQPLMGRCLTLGTKIFLRRHDPMLHERRPPAVHRDAGHQRIGGSNQPLRKAQSIRRQFFVVGVHHCRRANRH